MHQHHQTTYQPMPPVTQEHLQLAYLLIRPLGLSFDACLGVDGHPLTEAAPLEGSTP